MEVHETTTSVIARSLAAINEEFMKAFKLKDTQALGRLYTTDAEVMPPNADVIKGRDAIREMWHQATQAGFDEIRLTTTEVHATEDLGFETGRYKLFDKSGEEVDAGKYIVIWKQEAGAWKLHRDIWNSSMPAR